jgi:hypothetical protein
MDLVGFHNRPPRGVVPQTLEGHGLGDRFVPQKRSEQIMLERSLRVRLCPWGRTLRVRLCPSRPHAVGTFIVDWRQFYFILTYRFFFCTLWVRLFARTHRLKIRFFQLAILFFRRHFLIGGRCEGKCSQTVLEDKWMNGSLKGRFVALTCEPLSFWTWAPRGRCGGGRGVPIKRK